MIDPETTLEPQGASPDLASANRPATEIAAGPAPRPRRGFFRSLLPWIDSDIERAPLDDTRIDWLRGVPYFALHAAVLFVFAVGVSWFAVATAVFLYVARMFFITGFYHRYFSHRAFRANRFVQFLMAAGGCTAVQRGPLWWAGHHRHHHSYSDLPGDRHSPRLRGFLRAHMGWFLERGAFATPKDRVRDLVRFPELRFLDRFDWLPALGLGLAIWGLGALLERFAPSLGTNGPQLFVWGFVISTIVLYHATYTINSLSHIFGSRRFQTTDDSRNNLWLALLTLGEGWHNNHHHYPASARQGFHWWEIDVTFWILRVMQSLRIISDLKPVPIHLIKGTA